MYESYSPTEREELLNQYIVTYSRLSYEDTNTGRVENLEYYIVDTEERNSVRYPVVQLKRQLINNRSVISDIKLVDTGLLNNEEDEEIIFEALIESWILTAMASYTASVIVYINRPIGIEMLVKHNFSLALVKYIHSSRIQPQSVRAELCL